MPAPTANLPNLRRMFVADPGYTFIDIDFERADAQVVAADAGDKQLLEVFRQGKDIHTSNAQFLMERDKITKAERYVAKTFVHGTHYGGTARTLAQEGNKDLPSGSKITEKKAKDFIRYWYECYPNIKKWHDYTWQKLKKDRTIRNAFGFQIVFYDRIDAKTWREALSWVPQSTIALITNYGLCNIAENLEPTYGVRLLLQVHDSLPHQAPNKYLPELRESEDGKKLIPHGDCTLLYEIKRNMEVEIPYEDPLVIPVGLEAGPNWGDVKEVEL